MYVSILYPCIFISYVLQRHNGYLHTVPRTITSTEHILPHGLAQYFFIFFTQSLSICKVHCILCHSHCSHQYGRLILFHTRVRSNGKSEITRNSQILEYSLNSPKMGQIYMCRHYILITLNYILIGFNGFESQK